MRLPGSVTRSSNTVAALTVAAPATWHRRLDHLVALTLYLSCLGHPLLIVPAKT
jgi:hypothetical protein